MSERLEEELRATFTAAAARAPAPPPDLRDRIGTGLRRHRRRRRGQAFVAAVAVAAVVTGSTVASRGLSPGTGDGALSDPDVAGLPTAKVDDAVPIQQLWPGSTHIVPNRLPDGRGYYPLTLLDRQTLLVTPRRMDELLRYDFVAGKVTGITEFPRTFTDDPRPQVEGTTVPADFSVGDGHVVWWDNRTANGRSVAEIWSVPVTGGKAKLIASMAAPKNVPGRDSLTVVDGKATWSIGPGGGVYQVPVTGGKKALLPGTRGYFILRWPWAGKITTAGYALNAGALRNLRTGQVRQHALLPNATWACGVTWCNGSVPDDPRYPDRTVGRMLLQRRDGSGGAALPDGLQNTPERPPSLDRFITFAYMDTEKFRRPVATRVLYDLETGKAADLGTTASKDESTQTLFAPVKEITNPLFHYDALPSHYGIVDLTSID